MILYIFIGIIIGIKAVLLLYFSMILNWVGILGLDISFIIIFGLINGFLDTFIISKISKLNKKIVSYIVGIIITLFIMFLLSFTNYTLIIFDYIHYKRFGFKVGEFGPAGGLEIIFYYIIYSIVSIFFSFPITLLIIRIIKKWKIKIRRNFV
jgi:hypothetical protein